MNLADLLRFAGAALAVPIGLLLAYGLARTLALAFRELQGALFSVVAERAIRQAALKTFRHLHRLALRFHLDRQTGGLSRAIERGSRGIEFLLRVMLFNIIPTALEIGLVCALLWGMLDGWFALASVSTGRLLQLYGAHEGPLAWVALADLAPPSARQLMLAAVGGGAAADDPADKRHTTGCDLGVLTICVSGSVLALAAAAAAAGAAKVHGFSFRFVSYY